LKHNFEFQKSFAEMRSFFVLEKSTKVKLKKTIFKKFAMKSSISPQCLYYTTCFKNEFSLFLLFRPAGRKKNKPIDYYIIKGRNINDKLF